MMKKQFVILFLLGSLCASHAAVAGEDMNLIVKARKFARARKYNFAFMQIRTFLRDYPASKYREDALFAKGEYYFWLPDFDQSARTFRQVLTEFPDSESKLFVLAYLFRIAQLQGDQETAEQYKKEIVTLKQLSLVFRKFKEYHYHSPFERNHRAVFQIALIEFFVEGELLAKISY